MKMTGQDFGLRMFFSKSDPGRRLKGVDCFHCHGGAHFTNHQFLNNGRDGTAPLPDEGLARTSPYMHDGRFATVEEVIDHYDQGIQSSTTLDPNLAKHLSHGGLGLRDEGKTALGRVPESAERRAAGGARRGRLRLGLAVQDGTG